MKIKFYPESDDPTLVTAAAEYQAIWDARGDIFVKVLVAKTGLALPNVALNALVFEGTSRSHPLVLRASYPSDIKASALVHELGHKLQSANELIPEPNQDYSINLHKALNLFLYDAYLELFGDEKTAQVVEYESNLRPSYRACWQWACELSEAERAARFNRIKKNKADWLPYLNGHT